MRTARGRETAYGLFGVTAIAAGLMLLPVPGSRAAASGPTATASPSPAASASASSATSPGTSPSTSLSPSPIPSLSPSPSGSPSPSPTRTTRPRQPHGGNTVDGPRMWNPVSGKPFGYHSTVTVSQVANLVNEMVQVSWTGFTPSSAVLYDQTATDYPVMVAECDTTRPTAWKQCYGANNGGVQGAFGPFGPMNTAYATTAPNGTGELDIQILTVEENQFLGCSVHHACSLVIVPAQGGNTLSSPVDCHDHSLDAGGTDLGQFAFNSQTGSCSWNDRIVVPLRFAPAPTNCPIKKAAFTVLGSPMLARAMDQWRAALCASAAPLSITYNSALTEPEAIADVPTGLGDVALTTRPAPSRTIGGKTYTYAPVAVSAVAIAYWVDNPVTGRPVTDLKLDPRLVAKLITQSYDFENEGCGHGPPPKHIGCDGAVDGNPFSLFDDPEFKKLNPTIKAPVGNGAAFQVPTVESGHSDMTWDVTSWMAASKAASSFMAGQFDPWGMHLNTDYLGFKIPNDSFTSQDPYPVIAHQYSPVFPLSMVASYQAENWEPGTDWETDQSGNFPKDPIEVPGERALFAILDEADAAAFDFPTARLLNDKGRYVAPTDSSMAAALTSMVTDQSNKITQSPDFASQKANAYPLTMVIYAMVPTSGVSKVKASAIARFLDFVAGTGQQPGVQPGNLAPGYLPLPANLRAETLRAATEVASQSGKAGLKPGLSTRAIGNATGGLFPTIHPGLGRGVVMVSLKRPLVTGAIRYALPVLLIVGGAATLGGISSLVIGSVAGAPVGRLRRPRRVLRTTRRKQ